VNWLGVRGIEPMLRSAGSMGTGFMGKESQCGCV